MKVSKITVTIKIAWWFRWIYSPIFMFILNFIIDFIDTDFTPSFDSYLKVIRTATTVVK